MKIHFGRVWSPGFSGWDAAPVPALKILLAFETSHAWPAEAGTPNLGRCGAVAGDLAIALLRLLPGFPKPRCAIDPANEKSFSAFKPGLWLECPVHETGAPRQRRIDRARFARRSARPALNPQPLPGTS